MNNMPIQLLNMFKNGNPQQAALDILKQNSNGNPIIENVIKMANNNDVAGIESVVRNLCKTKGINADELIQEVKHHFG